MLRLYGRYVNSLEHSEAYLTRARGIITAAARFLHARLVEDGRRGACVDVSHTLSRFLNRLGIWNVTYNGALTLNFAASLGLKTTYFSPIFAPKGVVGHAWLSAAPFCVVDITLGSQPYSQSEDRHIPGLVLSETTSPAPVSVLDLVDDDALGDLMRRTGRPPSMKELAALVPGLQQDLTAFPAGTVTAGQVELLYAPWKASGMSGNLEEMRNLALSGKYPMELFREFEAERAAEGTAAKD